MFNGNGCSGGLRSRGQVNGPQPGQDEEEDYYYGSYSRPEIHRIMLKDSIRTMAYRTAICQNKHLFRGKTVLDVGCGTGILSMFAARAGARQVFGVDNSSIAVQARQIVLDNNLDNIITIIQGKVEEVELPVQRVDIIVSEWMGYCLFYESMLDSVLYARDKWLTTGGLIFPDIVRLYICGIEDYHYKKTMLDFWDEKYGFSFKPFKALQLEEPVVDYIKPTDVVTNVALLKEFNLEIHNKGDVEFDTEFELTMTKKETLTGLATYFDVVFSHCHLEVNFSTGPASPNTHWCQTTFFLKKNYHLANNEVIKGIFRMNKNKRCNRYLDFKIGFIVESAPTFLEENSYQLK